METTTPVGKIAGKNGAASTTAEKAVLVTEHLPLMKKRAFKPGVPPAQDLVDEAGPGTMIRTAGSSCFYVCHDDDSATTGKVTPMHPNPGTYALSNNARFARFARSQQLRKF